MSKTTVLRAVSANFKTSFSWVAVLIEATGVRWGDLNNDGLDDFICISREGAMYASINQGGNPPQFKYIGLVREAPGGGLAQANVRLGDIDGDGRID